MKETQLKTLEDWFAWRAELKRQGMKLTLKEIAAKNSYSYGYVKNRFSAWKRTRNSK